MCHAVCCFVDHSLILFLGTPESLAHQKSDPLHLKAIIAAVVDLCRLVKSTKLCCDHQLVLSINWNQASTGAEHQLVLSLLCCAGIMVSSGYLLLASTPSSCPQSRALLCTLAAKTSSTAPVSPKLCSIKKCYVQFYPHLGCNLSKSIHLSTFDDLLADPFHLTPWSPLEPGQLTCPCIQRLETMTAATQCLATLTAAAT